MHSKAWINRSHTIIFVNISCDSHCDSPVVCIPEMSCIACVVPQWYSLPVGNILLSSWCRPLIIHIIIVWRRPARIVRHCSMTIGITSTYIFSYKEFSCCCGLTGTKLVTPAAGCRLKVPLTIPAGVGVNRNELLGPAVCSLVNLFLCER